MKGAGLRRKEREEEVGGETENKRERERSDTFAVSP
jgi:hypothetical protein